MTQLQISLRGEDVPSEELIPSARKESDGGRAALHRVLLVQQCPPPASVCSPDLCFVQPDAQREV